MAEREFKRPVQYGDSPCQSFTLVGPKEWWAYPYQLLRHCEGTDRRIELILGNETVVIHGHRLNDLVFGFRKHLIRSVRFMPRYEWFLQESRGWDGPRVERINVEGRQSFPIR